MTDDRRTKDGLLARLPDGEDSLAVAQAMIQALMDSVSSGVAIYEATDDGEDFVFVDFNRAAEQIEQIRRGELIGKSVLDVFPGVRRFGLFEVLQRVWRTGRPEHHPVSIYKDDRIAGWRENYVFRLPSGHVVAVYDDASLRKRSELAARLTEQCFRAIADYTYDWEVWVGPNGRVLWTNPAVLRVTGYTVAELTTMKDYPSPLVYPDDRHRILKAFRAALDGGTGNDVQFRIERKDGNVVWVEMSWQPIYDDEDHSLGHRQSIRDITDRKIAEQALRESEQRYRRLAEHAT